MVLTGRAPLVLPDLAVVRHGSQRQELRGARELALPQAAAHGGGGALPRQPAAHRVIVEIEGVLPRVGAPDASRAPGLAPGFVQKQAVVACVDMFGSVLGSLG